MLQRPATQAARPLARITERIARLMSRRTEAKASAAGPLIAMETGRGEPVWTPRDYASFAREGVMQNAIVYRAVRMIAENAASVPLLLYERDNEIVEHPLLDLLARPSPGMTGTDLLRAFTASCWSRAIRTSRRRASAGSCASCMRCGPTA